MKIFRLTLVVLFIAGAVFAQDKAAPDAVKSAAGISVETSVDRSEIYIGDLITYKLIIVHDSDIVLTPPPIGANLGAFDVKDYKSDDVTHLDNGQLQNESRFVLTTFTTGDYIIPPIPIEFMRPDSTVEYLLSEPIAIKVKSLIAAGADTADIREVKSPLAFKSGWPWWGYAIAGGLLVLLVAGFVYWKFFRKKKEPGEFVDRRDPWEIAYEKLAHLKEKNYPAEGSFKMYYVVLTEIVRDYLGRIYKIPVLDMTTMEFLDIISEEDIDEDIMDTLKKFLNHADLVKFAKLIPSDEQMQQDFDIAHELVDRIRILYLSRMAPVAVPNAVSDTETEEQVNV